MYKSALISDISAGQKNTAYAINSFRPFRHIGICISEIDFAHRIWVKSVGLKLANKCSKVFLPTDPGCSPLDAEVRSDDFRAGKLVARFQTSV